MKKPHTTVQNAESTIYKYTQLLKEMKATIDESCIAVEVIRRVAAHEYPDAEQLSKRNLQILEQLKTASTRLGIEIAQHVARVNAFTK